MASDNFKWLLFSTVESDQTTNTLSNILMMMTSEPANPLPCSFCSWIVSVKMRPLSFSPYLSHWCQKKYKKMKVEPNKKLLFIPFYFYKAVYYSENNQRGCFLEIPVEMSLSDKYTSRQYKKNNLSFYPLSIRWMTLCQRFHDEQ